MVYLTKFCKTRKHAGGWLHKLFYLMRCLAHHQDYWKLGGRGGSKPLIFLTTEIDGVTCQFTPKQVYLWIKRIWCMCESS